MVLLHGLGSSHRTWDLLLPYLAGTFSIVRLDLPGHGASRERRESDDLESLRGQLLRVFEYLGLTEPIIVGHSWGASLALDLAAHSPVTVSKLILIDGGYMDFSHVPGMTWDRLEHDLAPPRIDVSSVDFTAAMKSALGPHWRAEFASIFTSHMREIDGRISARLPYDDHIQYLRGMWEHDVRTLYPAILIPTLLIVASFPGPGTIDWDDLRRRTLAEMQRLMPLLRIVRMEDTLHDVPMDRPAELAKEMLNFLE